MAENSKIEWTDHTFNPWRGCTKVSAGCTNCYADTQAKRNPGTLGIWGPNGTRVVAAEKTWQEPVKWNKRAECLRTFDCNAGDHADCCPQKVRPRVFCASMADVFEDWDGQMRSHSGCQLWVNEADQWEQQALPGRSDEIFFESGFKPLRIYDVRNRLFRLIDATPNLDWLLLTKRPENIRRMWVDAARWVETGDQIWQLERPIGSRRFQGVVSANQCGGVFSLPLGYRIIRHGETIERGEGDRATIEQCKAEVERVAGSTKFRKNVWLLTSVENQEQADKRIPELLKCRQLAPVLGLSCEPLLGLVDLSAWIGSDESFKRRELKKLHNGAPINWVIVGGESGHDARPMHPDWVRSLRDQAAASDVAFFFKQWGEWREREPSDNQLGTLVERHPGLPVLNHGALHMVRVGKKAAGRLLDGELHNAFPGGWAGTEDFPPPREVSDT